MTRHSIPDIMAAFSRPTGSRVNSPLPLFPKEAPLTIAAQLNLLEPQSFWQAKRIAYGMG